MTLLLRFSLVPKLVHFAQCQVFDVAPCSLSFSLDIVEAVSELLVGALKSVVRIELI